MLIRLDRFDNRAFDRGAPRWKEALWLLVKRVFFLSSFPWPARMRAFWLRRFGANIGAGLVIRSRVNITFPWRFSCGDHVWIGEEVLILSLAPVALGSHVCLSQRAFLCTGNHDFRSEGFDLLTAPITIGSHSWVAAMAFVGPGVALPENSRVHACQCVTKSGSGAP